MPRFLVYLQPAQEGGYIVSAPALPLAASHKERRLDRMMPGGPSWVPLYQCFQADADT